MISRWNDSLWKAHRRYADDSAAAWARRRISQCKRNDKRFDSVKVARLEGFEPPTLSSGGYTKNNTLLDFQAVNQSSVSLRSGFFGRVKPSSRRVKHGKTNQTLASR
jgi:hypothetical protein